MPDMSSHAFKVPAPLEPFMAPIDHDEALTVAWARRHNLALADPTREEMPLRRLLRCVADYRELALQGEDMAATTLLSLIEAAKCAIRGECGRFDTHTLFAALQGIARMLADGRLPAKASKCAYCGGESCVTGKWNGDSTPCPSDCCAKHDPATCATAAANRGDLGSLFQPKPGVV